MIKRDCNCRQLRSQLHTPTADDNVGFRSLVNELFTMYFDIYIFRRHDRTLK